MHLINHSTAAKVWVRRAKAIKGPRPEINKVLENSYWVDSVIALLKWFNDTCH